MKVFTLLLFIFIHLGHAAEKAESFVIEGHDRFLKVVAPEIFSSQSSLIIENKMLAKLYGKIETTTGRFVGHISVLSKNFKTVTLDLKREEGALFIPLSPPFQEVELVFGRGSYEIPPQKRN